MSAIAKSGILLEVLSIFFAHPDLFCAFKAALVRLSEHDPAGKEIARNIGVGGQEWAQKILRNEDMDDYSSKAAQDMWRHQHVTSRALRPARPE